MSAICLPAFITLSMGKSRFPTSFMTPMVRYELGWFVFIEVGGDGQPKSELCRDMTAVGENDEQSWDISFESELAVPISMVFKPVCEVPESVDLWNEDCSPSAEFV